MRAELCVISVMRPFASHPVSPMVTVSAPGSGYEHSAAVHAGVTGHPAAGSRACIQPPKRQAAKSNRNDHGRLCSVPVPSKERLAPQPPRAADPARCVRTVSLQLRAMLAGDDQGEPGGTCGSPDRAPSARRMVRVLGLSWGFAGGRCWVRTNVGLAGGFTSLKERAGVKGWCARFSAGSGPGFRHAGGRPGVKVERPAGRTTLTLALSSGARWRRPGTVRGLGGWRAPRAVRVLGRLAAAFIPSGVPAAGCRGGMGRVRVRAAGSIRATAAPPGGGGQ